MHTPTASSSTVVIGARLLPQDATCNGRHATYNACHATCNGHHATCNGRHATCNGRHSTCSARNMQPPGLPEPRALRARTSRSGDARHRAARAATPWAVRRECPIAARRAVACCCTLHGACRALHGACCCASHGVRLQAAHRCRRFGRSTGSGPSSASVWWAGGGVARPPPPPPPPPPLLPELTPLSGRAHLIVCATVSLTPPPTILP
jgi:hypothetical protein